MKIIDRFKQFIARPKIKAKKRYYRVGDIAPPELLNHKAGDGNLGAMISIDPETKRILAIFVP